MTANREFEPINHADIADIWGPATAKIFERFMAMPAEDREIIVNRPKTTDRAADSVYRRRCTKWGISTGPRGLTKDPGYTERANAMQRVRDLEQRIEKMKAEGQRVQDDRKKAQDEIDAIRSMLAHAAVIERSDFSPAHYASLREAVRALLELVRPGMEPSGRVADWLHRNLCDKCLSNLEETIHGARGEIYCEECQKNFEKVLSYARALRNKKVSSPG